MVWQSLNPCSNGMTIELQLILIFNLIPTSLNPCSNGMTIEYYIILNVTLMDTVLILVLMEWQ